ncbi:hypothetical protein Tco_1308903 [Tanacetum coccineum]
MLTCRRTCQVRSHHQNSREAGMSKDISGDEESRSEGTKLIQIFIKVEVTFTKLKQSTIAVIIEYLVNISKRRAFWSLNEDILKINDSDYQYAVSIKEDTAYQCLHSPKTTKERRSIRRIQKKSIRCIEDIVCEYSGRYQTWSLL